MSDCRWFLSNCKPFWCPCRPGVRCWCKDSPYRWCCSVICWAAHPSNRWVGQRVVLQVKGISRGSSLHFLQLTKRMSTVLIVAQIFALRTIIGLVTLLLLIVKSESATPTIRDLQRNLNKTRRRAGDWCLYLAGAVGWNLYHLRWPRQLEDLLLSLKDLLNVARPAWAIWRWFIRHFSRFPFKADFWLFLTLHRHRFSTSWRWHASARQLT